MASSSSNKRPCPSESKEATEPMVVLVHFESGNAIFKATASFMQEDFSPTVKALLSDLSRMKEEAAVPLPKSRHDLWSRVDIRWNACRREDLKNWTPVDFVLPIKCECVYFWEP
jgi:hypothetical protein